MRVFGFPADEDIIKTTVFCREEEVIIL